MAETNPVPGETVASFLRKNGKLGAGARLGVEKRGISGWEEISLRYVIRAGDTIRVRAAKNSGKSTSGLEALAKMIATAQRS